MIIMPSKKKARSKARRAKKEKARQQAAGRTECINRSRAPGGASCTHIKLPDNRTLDDFQEACALFEDFVTMFEFYHSKMDEALGVKGDIQMTRDIMATTALQLDRDILPKCLFLLNNESKDVFQQLVISKGIQLILSIQDAGVDFIQFASITTPAIGDLAIFLLPLISLITCIENGGGDPSYSQVNHTYASPREVIKMFHRRSSCSCLKGLYYNLKDNTPKKTVCNGCNEISNAKNIFECDCKNRIYCSRECAKNDWPNHKRECRAYKHTESPQTMNLFYSLNEIQMCLIL
jgi:hypothetical protein